MGGLLTIVVLIACIALILFVLVQNPKGGGLNAEFGSAVQLGGAKRATDILEKGTWGIAISIGVICLAMALGGNKVAESTSDGGMKTDVNAIENTMPPASDNGNLPEPLK